MSYSEESYQCWIQSQLEPDEVITTGKAKKAATPAWVEQGRAIEQMQNEMGIEAYKYMIEEEKARLREWH